MDLSIIIPCFNSGIYLPDALASIKGSTNLSNYAYEVIIVDDGSTEALTIQLLESLPKEEYLVLHQTNAGPGAARNTGMRHSSGDYILFLDSDNKLKPDFIEVGIATLNREEADMVYGKPSFFGESSEARFRTYPFNLEDILRGNYIDTCSIIRRKVWEETGGFDENPILIGHEDWDFWIHLGSLSYKLYFIDRELYEYRITRESLIVRKNDLANRQAVFRYVYSKNLDLIIEIYGNTFYKKIVYENDMKRPIRSFFKFMYLKYLKK